MTHAPGSNRHGDGNIAGPPDTSMVWHIRTTLRGTLRKKRAIWIGVAITGLAATGVLDTTTSTLEAELAARRRDLASVQELHARYRDLRAALDATDRSAAPRPETTSARLWAVVEAAARGTVGAQCLASLTPTDTGEPPPGSGTAAGTSAARQGIELRVDGAPLGRIVDLLHTLEQNATALDVKRLHLTRATSTDGTLDATLAIMGSIPAR